MNRMVLIVFALTLVGVGIQFGVGVLNEKTPATDASFEDTSIAGDSTVAASPEAMPRGPQPSLFHDPEISNETFVDRAYAAIPHRRIRFDPTNPSLLPSHREYLHQVSALIDQAILWRVSGMQALVRQAPERDRWPQAGARLIQGLERLQPPPEARRYHAFVLESFDALRHFFQLQAYEPDPAILADPSKDPVLVRASNAAREAYAELKRIYPNLDAAAESAFYDTHLALDPL